MSVYSYGWNGSTLTFQKTAGSVAINIVPLTDLRHTDDPTTFDITGSTDAGHMSGAGLAKNGFSASFLGSQVPTAGLIGAIGVNIAGAGASSPATYTYPEAFITQLSISGRKDGRIEGNMSVVPGATSLSVTTNTQPTIGNLGFNGSTFSFASVSIVGMISANYSATATAIDCTGASDTETLYCPGLIEETLTITALGSIQTGVVSAIKAVGASAMTWADGGTLGSGVNWKCTGIHDGGSLDGQTTCEYTFKATRSTQTING